MALTGIETERLRLRQWRPDDRGPFRALNADPVVMEFFPTTLAPAESDALADRIADHISDHGWGLWAVEVIDRDPFIGFIGLWPAGIGGRELRPMVEVGWRLERRAWGHGYATEGAIASVRDGFTRLGLDEVVSFTARVNWRSRAVMERLGMRRDPRDDFLHPALAADHPLAPHVLYRLRQAEAEPRWSD